MELAAIASAAVPGLAPTGVAGAPDDAADFDSALLVDDAGKQWRVRSPKHAEASMRLETELRALRAFTPAIKAELPFLIPHMAGSVRQGELSTFVYSHLVGTTHSLDGLTDRGQPIAEEIGRVIAAIHELPKEMVQRADLPSYEADEYRHRKLNELDQAATTGRIPSVLLRRWERALEDVALWRFGPTVVHGDLHEDHLLISAGRVSAVTGWTDLSIGDPAEDFAWLAAVEDAAFVDAVYAAYAGARTTVVDPQLTRRAALAAEFALAQWLVRGVVLEDAAMVHEAEGMLATLQADVELVEREQREAAEQARRAHEERIEWGDELGTDPDGRRPGDSHSLHGNRTGDADRTDGGMPPGTGTDGIDDGPDGEVRKGPVDHHPSAGQDRTGGAGRTAAPADEDGSRPSGSSAYSPEAPEDRDDPRSRDDGAARTDSTHDDRSGRHHDDHGAPSGSSLAYARMVAGRERSTASSTASRLGNGGSPDDVATSALPIVSFGR